MASDNNNNNDDESNNKKNEATATTATTTTTASDANVGLESTAAVPSAPQQQQQSLQQHQQQQPGPISGDDTSTTPAAENPSTPSPQTTDRNAPDSNPDQTPMTDSSPPGAAPASADPAPTPQDAPSNPTTATQTVSATTADNAGSQPAAQPRATTATDNDDSRNAEILESSGSKIEEASEQLASSSARHESDDAGPSLVLTLLLTTGARHPFRIDSRYLRKRGVNVPDYDPFAMSVYTLKELILREWRSEWEPRPSSPSAIRLISFGKLLQDKAPLSESKFNHNAPNVIHMTVKPQEVVDEEDAKVAKASHGRDREAGEGSPSCRCVIL